MRKNTWRGGRGAQSDGRWRVGGAWGGEVSGGKDTGQPYTPSRRHAAVGQSTCALWRAAPAQLGHAASWSVVASCNLSLFWPYRSVCALVARVCTLQLLVARFRTGVKTDTYLFTTNLSLRLSRWPPSQGCACGCYCTASSASDGCWATGRRPKPAPPPGRCSARPAPSQPRPHPRW